MRTKHSSVQDGRAHSARYWRVYSKSVRDGERGGSGLALPPLEITSLLIVKQDSLDEAPFDFAQDRLRRIRDARRICSPDFLRAMKLII